METKCMQARPSLEQGSIGDILDVNLLAEPCNMEMMLQMGRIGLRCVVKEPKHRPTMRQVWKEIEEALEPLSKHARRSSSATAGHHSNGSISSRSIERAGQVGSMDLDYSQSFVSINGVGFQKFHVEMDSLSLVSTSLRCFEDRSTVSLSGKQNSPFLLSTNYPHSSITHLPEKSSIKIQLYIVFWW